MPVHARWRVSPGRSPTTRWCMPPSRRAIALAAPIPRSPSAACTETRLRADVLNSDTVLSYEAGTKDRFLGGRVQVAGSIFYLKWNNIQQSNYLPSCGFQVHDQPGLGRKQRLRARRPVLDHRQSRCRFQPRLHRSEVHHHECHRHSSLLGGRLRKWRQASRLSVTTSSSAPGSTL